MNNKMIRKFFDSFTPLPEMGCWIWDECGGEKARYPSLWNRDRKVMERANRFSYELHKGEIPEGMVVRHTCDVTWCVNPDHLVLGTQYDNVQDTVNRGRLNCRKGESNGRAKLSNEDVLFIKNAPAWNREGTGFSHNKLAEMFSVSKGTIEQIRRGIRWSHLETTVSKQKHRI